MHPKRLLAVAALAASFGLFGLATGAVGSDADALRQRALQQFGRVEAATAAERESPEARLGRALFWDARISVDHRTSCASCHAAADGGADRRTKPVDARGKTMPRHSQSVFNAMQQPLLRWLGDRPDAAKMAEGLLTGPLGFASREDALAALQRAGYGPRFAAVYGDAAGASGLEPYGRAIAAYQATLGTPAAFDRYLAGEQSLDVRQLAGLRRFMDAGCVACHSGPLLGGRGFQRFGIARDYASVTGSDPVDPGRVAVTGKEEDRHVFRVPMLRNVAQTAPYFHDGSVATLPAAVRAMGELQLGRKLGDTEVAEIVAFLGALSGEVPAHYASPTP
jgi:cytochrome c peroxidase